MRILIAGAGDVGAHLAKMLSSGNHDILLLDNDEDRLKEVAAEMHLITHTGSATSIEKLTQAGIGRTDLFISVTNSEHINITAAILAKKLGAVKCLARIDNPEYIHEENKEYFSQLGIDYMFYPELLAATEIVDLIQQSGTTDIMNIASGKLFLYVMRVDENAPALNQTIDEFHNLSKDSEYKIVAINRICETILPQGSDKLEDKDQVYIITTQRGIELLMKNFGKKSVNVKNVMILGGSRIGRNTAKQLAHNHILKLVERDRTKSYALSNELHGTLVINGDGTNVDLMEREGLASMDAFIAVTGNTETNMLACMLAKRLGVKKTIAEVENPAYLKLAENMGIDTIVNKKIITASKIFGFTMSDDVSSVKCLTGSDAEVMEFVVKPDSKMTQGSLAEIGFPKDAVIGGVVRGKTSIIPDSNITFRPFDRVVIFALPTAINKVGRFFSSQNRFF
jgi:trk system potassium uptake protein TrkA